MGPQGRGVDSGGRFQSDVVRRHAIPARADAEDRGAAQSAGHHSLRPFVGGRAFARAGLGADRAQSRRRNGPHRAAHRRRRVARIAEVSQRLRHPSRLRLHQSGDGGQRISAGDVRAIRRDAVAERTRFSDTSRRRRATRRSLESSSIDRSRSHHRRARKVRHRHGRFLRPVETPHRLARREQDLQLHRG